jgi:opacity protein-like surface antigen
MKTFLIAAVGGLVFSSAALGGQAPVAAAAQPRADVHGVAGWQSLRAPRLDSTFDRYGDDWANDIGYGGAGVGWYWTEHLKTQIDVGAGTEGEHYQHRLITVGGQSSSESSRRRIQKTSLALSQQYQFFRNQWFHPHVGLGVDLARETATTEFTPVFIYDPVARTSRQISDFRTEGPLHRAVVRPFGEVGFKAYMTQRAFFTTDARLLFRGDLEEVLFRFGFGVDF